MATLTLEQALAVAVQHHRAGRLSQAESIYRTIIAQQAKPADAWVHLGLLARRARCNDVAADLFRRALAIDSDHAPACNNLGNALTSLGRLDDAVAAYRRAIALDPANCHFHNNLGNALGEKKQPEEAISACRAAIALEHNFPQAHYNLGNALRDKGETDQAIVAFREAIFLKPDYAQAHNNLGSVLKEKGQLEQAAAAFGEAIAVEPGRADTHSNLGAVLTELGRLDEGIAALRQAIALQPGLPPAHCNLGNALIEKGELDDAITAFRTAITLRPDYPEAHSNLSHALKSRGLADQAIAASERAIALAPDFPQAHVNLANALAARQRLDEAVAAYRHAIALKPDYAEAHNDLGNALKDKGELDQAIDSFRRAIALRPDLPEPGSNLLYAVHFHPACDAKTLFAEHQLWNRRHAEPLARLIQPHSNDRNPARRLRIGYVSPYFREHPVGRFLLPLLAHHDENHVEVFAYAQVTVPDALTESLRSHAACWRNIHGLPDAQAADLIRQDRIDILVDLTMHMSDNRLLLFARKPAPVQVTYLAYCSTTGLQTIDYRLSDPYLDPPGQDESIYSERTIRLPETYWCYQPHVSLPDDSANTAPAAQRGYITFGCLNNFCKVSQPVLAAWIRLLCAVPGSHLLIHAHQGSHRQRLLDQFRQAGIEGSRVQFAGLLPAEEYFALYRQIDIALDTFPYGGGTTTCDALWMGVPVVSLMGKTAVGRGGFSILSNLGLTDLVARSEDAYVQIAFDLSRDPERLNDLRRTLRQRMSASPLMDAAKFTGGVEQAYRRMWCGWCDG